MRRRDIERHAPSLLLALVLASATACQRQPSAVAPDDDPAAAPLRDPASASADLYAPDDDADLRADEDGVDRDGTDPDLEAVPHTEGVFTGVMPCETCPGLETTLYLHADGGYELVEREGDHAPASRRQGVWYASADGNAILIADDENGAGHHIFEWYGEDALRLLPDASDPDWEDAFLLVRAN